MLGLKSGLDGVAPRQQVNRYYDSDPESALKAARAPCTSAIWASGSGPSTGFGSVPKRLNPANTRVALDSVPASLAGAGFQNASLLAAM